MNKTDYNRLNKLIQQERNNILENQDGLDIINMDKSIDKAVLNNLSTKLSKQDLNKVTSIISHYYNRETGQLAHQERQKLKVNIQRKIMKFRRKQKGGWKK